jgi:hypothetical protein
MREPVQASLPFPGMETPLELEKAPQTAPEEQQTPLLAGTQTALVRVTRIRTASGKQTGTRLGPAHLYGTCPYLQDMPEKDPDCFTLSTADPNLLAVVGFCRSCLSMATGIPIDKRGGSDVQSKMPL